MLIVVYACVPVDPDLRAFRRVRITYDSTKVESYELSTIGDEHNSCNHRPTCHQYLASREVKQLYEQMTLRPCDPGEEGLPFLPESIK